MHSWLDQLLRPLLQISSLLHIEADRRPSDTLGSTQVQTPTATTEARANMVGWRGQTHAGALPSVAAFYMRTAGYWEPYESRGSRTVVCPEKAGMFSRR